MRRRRAFVLLGPTLCAAFWAGGCQTRQALSHGHRSPSALAETVVQALDHRDVPGLRAVALTEAEFRDVVWPSLPASRPVRNIPWDYAWDDLQGKSDAHLRTQVSAWEDRGYRVVSVAFEGATTDFGRFRVRRNGVVTLRDADGRETEGRLFGSMIEMDGRFKVFSYVVD